MQLVERTCCPACGGTPASDPLVSLRFDVAPIRNYLGEFYGGRLDLEPLIGKRYELLSCPTCRLVYRRLVPDDEYLAHLYGTAALSEQDAAANDRGLATRRGYADQIEQMLVHFGRSPRGVAVLDYGSGSAIWLDMAAAFGCRTAGAELSDAARRRLEARGHEVFAPHAIPPEAFDFVNAEQVLEHVVDPLDVMRELRSCVRVGGVVRVCVPNGHDVVERLVDADWQAPKGSPRSLNAVAPLEHLNCFDHHSLEQLGRAAGFTPFAYPLRSFVRGSVRLRAVAGALVRTVRPARGTLQLFRRINR